MSHQSKYNRLIYALCTWKISINLEHKITTLKSKSKRKPIQGLQLQGQHDEIGAFSLLCSWFYKQPRHGRGQTQLTREIRQAFPTTFSNGVFSLQGKPKLPLQSENWQWKHKLWRKGQQSKQMNTESLFQDKDHVRERDHHKLNKHLHSFKSKISVWESLFYTWKLHWLITNMDYSSTTNC